MRGGKGRRRGGEERGGEEEGRGGGEGRGGEGRRREMESKREDGASSLLFCFFYYRFGNQSEPTHKIIKPQLSHLHIHSSFHMYAPAIHKIFYSHTLQPMQ